MVVTREALEQNLMRVEEAVRDPACGLYGPDTLAWTVSRESVLFLGGGRAALLQLAHPFVAHGVEHHSRTRIDPQGRFVRTFAAVFAIVFGDLPAALRAARAVHGIHTRVTGTLEEGVGAYPRGSSYAANDPNALMWVHATLFDTALLVFERAVRPFTPVERERYYQESRRFAHLFGVPDDVLPANYPAFRRYFDDMLGSDRLGVGRLAAELGGFILAPPRPVMAPLMRWYRVMTAGLMPERFRAPYGLRFEAADRALFTASMGAIKAGYRLTPGSARHLPDYVEAMRRVKGRPRPHVFGRLAERVVVRSIQRP